MDSEAKKLIERSIEKLQLFQDERPPGDGAVQDAIDNLNEALDLLPDCTSTATAELEKENDRYRSGDQSH